MCRAKAAKGVRIPRDGSKALLPNGRSMNTIECENVAVEHVALLED
jgi:hypothetical protein